MKLLYLASFVTLVSCTGHLEIRLKSDYQQDLTLVLTQGSNPFHVALPIRVLEKTEHSFGKFPIDFSESHSIQILGGKIEKLGINGSTYRADFNALRGSISPKQLHLPLSGLDLLIECDENWSGDKCDIRCEKSSSDKCSVELIEQDMTMTTDYSIDLEKLPTIIKRLKETTKVDNAIRKADVQEEEKLKRRDEEIEKEKLVIRLNKEKKIFEQTSETVEWKKEKTEKEKSTKELVGDLFGAIRNFVNVAGSGKKGGESPFRVSMKLSTEDDLQEEHGPSFPSFFKDRSKPKKGMEEMAGSLMSMFSSDPEPKEESPLASFGMGLPMGLGPLSLLSMLPRMPRQVEGSGQANDDFAADQIIKN